MDIPEGMNILPREGLQVQLVGEIERGDLPALAERQREGKKELKRLRSVHHCAARMMAAGHKDVEVAARTGMHPNRIYMLKDDPAFQGLVEHYQEQEEEVWLDARRRAAQVGTLAMEALQDKLLEDPDSLTPKQLLEIMEKGLSHGGFPATQRVESDSTSHVLQEIKQEQDQGVVVSGEVERRPVGGREVVGARSEAGEDEVPEEASWSEVREESREDAPEPLSLDDLRPVARVSSEREDGNGPA